MDTKVYIKDKTDSKDEEKIIYHFLSDELKAFNRRKNTYVMLAILSFLITVVGVILLPNRNTDGFGRFMVFLGGGGILTSIPLLLINRIPVKIKKIGLVHLPVSHMNFQKGSILVDRSGLINPTEFKFTSLNPDDIRQVNDLYASLTKQTEEMPCVLSDDITLDIPSSDENYRKQDLKIYKEEVNLIHLNQDVQQVFSKTENYHIALRAFLYYEEFLNWLKSNTKQKPEHIYETVKEEDILQDINKIDGIVDFYKKEKEEILDIDVLCLELLAFFDNSLPRIDYSVYNSLNQIAIPDTFNFTNIIERASYNYYCPDCNKELIEKLEKQDYAHNGKSDNRVFFPANTLMEMVELENNLWQCPLCNHKTSRPFAKHKMEDELFTPVYDKLYEENYLERLKVYNHINDEKRNFTEKAETLFHQVIRESRTKVDQIKSKIRTVQSEISSDDIAVQDLNSILLKYKRIAKEKFQQIEHDLVNHKKAIEEENQKSKKRIDKAVDEAKKNIDESTKKYATLEREDQAKRDAIQQKIAANTAATANILHAMAKHDGTIKDKNIIGQAIDWFFDKKNDSGLNSGEKWNHAGGGLSL
jgi:hypothetical protein